MAMKKRAGYKAHSFRRFTKSTLPKVVKVVAKPPSPQEQAFRHIMRCHSGVVEEFHFAPGRKFRADYAFPDKMLLIEYEGINSAKSRHTTRAGYSKDCEKYNLAATLGYRVLRYTAINFRNVWRDLELILGPKPAIIT